MNILEKFLHPERVSAAEVKNVLLVGDDFPWLPANARLAGRTVRRCANRDEAIAQLADEAIDGVVACLPEFGKNLALLNFLNSEKPGRAYALRADPAQVARLALDYPVFPAVQSTEILDDLVRTMFATAKWNSDPSFNNLKAQIKRFPALPSLYSQITEALQKPDASIEEVAGLVAREPAITAKLLQVINSPVFGLRQRVTSVRDAASFLGMQRIRALVLSTSLVSQCETSKCPSFVAEAFEAYGLQIANWAAQIAVGETRNRKLGELAFTAGLLHQFGILLLASNLPESYDAVLRTASEQNVSIARIERQTYGVTHAELAGFVLAGWHIPYSIVNAVGFYSLPSESSDQEVSPLTAVHIATTLDTFASTDIQDYDRTYLDNLGILPRLDHWSRTLIERPWPQSE